jgi:prevent-host-death family protein
MSEITIRELRNHGGDVLERVARGEALTVARRPLPAAVLLERWRRLPAVDPARLRADVDGVLDGSL